MNNWRTKKAGKIKKISLEVTSQDSKQENKTHKKNLYGIEIKVRIPTGYWHISV
jgi:hypothetical protein